MQTTPELRAGLRWLRKHAGLKQLRPCPEEMGFEIVRIETVREHPSEFEHIAYGFRARCNDVIVGGLCELEVAQVLMKHKLVGSYVDQELWRQSF